MAPLTASGLVGRSLRPDPGTARSWVERELRRADYHESVLQRFLSWLSDLWDQLTSSALGASRLSTAAAAVVTVALVVLVLLVVSRAGRDPRRDGQGDPVLAQDGTSPQQHRDAAEAALRDGAFDTAIVEAFRALAARAVRRGLVEGRPGLTADELAADLAPAFPEHAERLRAASLLFDLVFYGEQPASADDARSVLDLEESLRTARPGSRPADLLPPTAAVPR